MSQNEQTNLPIAINLLDEKKSIVTLNNENGTILEQITKELDADKYNSIVTMENYKVMKESATELNKTSKFISDFRIAKKKDEMKHIDEFETNLKGYCELINDKRDTIKDGLNVFEDETRKQVLAVCEDCLKTEIELKGLREEFANIDVSDMTQTGFMTAKGLVSKKGKDEIEKRVNEKLALQNKVDNRLLNLENECLKNGIAPMSKEYVQGFLLEDDATYQEKLNALIQIEVKRAEAEKNRIEDETRIKAEREAAERYVAQQQKAKAELHAKYEGAIKTASIAELTKINLELKSYEMGSTYELRELSNKRQMELENPVNDEEVKQEEHLKAIQEEETKTVSNPYQELNVPEDGKVSKTLSIKIRVPANATDEQVIGAVINMIKADRFPLENIEVV